MVRSDVTVKDFKNFSQYCSIECRFCEIGGISFFGPFSHVKKSNQSCPGNSNTCSFVLCMICSSAYVTVYSLISYVVSAFHRGNIP